MKRKSKTKVKTDRPTPPIRKEIRGLVFLFMAIILGGSLLSYHSGDKLFWNVTGSLGNSQNLFGTVGAHLAGGTFFLLGFSSFWLVVILIVMSFLSFKGCPLSSPIETTIAALALLVSFSGILNLQFLEVVSFRSGNIIAGGLLGIYLAGLTEGYLNHFGAYVLLFTIFIIS
ncbi:MAG TPA: hypothetical protein DDW42_07355, partial [Desulfobacteraceae bacterium]|nr:hypothetical protein [Desulfobacteraceae bacterium]